MVRHDQRVPSVQVRASPQPPNRVSGGKQRLRGERPERHYNLRVDQLDLPEKERRASRDLFRIRIPVTRRSALEHVADVNLVAPEADGQQQEVQQLSGSPDERTSRIVLDCPRSLAHAHHSCLRIAFPEDDVLATLVQRAPSACPGYLAEGIEVQLTNPLGRTLLGQTNELRLLRGRRRRRPAGCGVDGIPSREPSEDQRRLTQRDTCLDVTAQGLAKVSQVVLRFDPVCGRRPPPSAGPAAPPPRPTDPEE